MNFTSIHTTDDQGDTRKSDKQITSAPSGFKTSKQEYHD